jgi:hypothetical protein
MKKLISLLLVVTVLALPLCSFAEGMDAAALMSNKVISTLAAKLLNGGSLTSTTTYSLTGIEPYTEIEGIGPQIALVADLLNALSVNETVSLSPAQVRAGVGLNGAEVIDFTFEAAEDNLYIGSSLLGSAVIAVTGDEIKTLLKQAGIDLDEIVAKLQNLGETLSKLTFENTQAFFSGMQPQVNMVELDEQPADADPAAIKAEIVLPETFFADFAAAVAADMQANAAVFGELGVEVGDMSDFQENIGKLRLANTYVYLSENQELVAFETELGNGEESVAIKVGIQNDEFTIVTCTVDAAEAGVLRAVIEMKNEITDESISYVEYCNFELTAEGETNSFSIVETVDLALEGEEVVGITNVTANLSALPGLTFVEHQEFTTGAPVASIATEDAVHVAAMEGEEMSSWLQSTLMPNVMVVLGKVLQNAPESVSSLVMQLMGMDAPVAQ